MSYSHRERVVSSVVWYAVVAARLVASLQSSSPPTTPGATRIPLCTGLTIVTAIDRPEGDYESVKRITSVTDRDITLNYSTQIPDGSHTRDVLAKRSVLRKDLESATLYMHYFSGAMHITIPGSTAIGTSAAVLHALKTSGAAQLAIVPAVYSASDVDPKTHPSVYDYQMKYTLRRVGAAPVMIPVIVNDTPLQLPAIQARGDYIGDRAEFFFLDDESNPIALRYRIGSATSAGTSAEAARLEVVRITYRCSGERPAARTSALEEALSKAGRADVYDLYFDFNSDRIRDESEPTLREIADLLARHRDWKLSIEGHTDGIAGDAYNLDLSRRRAAAVKRALTASYRIDGGRLTTAGYGKSRPKDRNDTLQGRARNRRVELVRVS